jgi:hypothetical protein
MSSKVSLFTIVSFSKTVIGGVLADFDKIFPFLLAFAG